MKFINIHTHVAFSGKNELNVNNIFPGENAEIEPDQQYSIGLHPWYIDIETKNDLLEEIHQSAKKSEVIAIGETGLDKRCETSFELQTEVFEKHIQISESVKKPLIIHCVKAFNELIQLKKNHKPKFPWIVHGFNAKLEVAEMLIRQNIFLSFGKALMYPLSNAAQVLARIPNDWFFFETDDSEYKIMEIYKAASEIRKMEIDNMKSIILQNFKNCF